MTHNASQRPLWSEADLDDRLDVWRSSIDFEFAELEVQRARAEDLISELARRRRAAAHSRRPRRLRLRDPHSALRDCAGLGE